MEKLKEELNVTIANEITQLINEANAMSCTCDVQDIGDVEMYENIDDSKIYIDKSIANAENAKKNLEVLKELPESHFYTFGRNKNKTEQTQVVLGEVITAVEQNTDATKALFNNQARLALFSKRLFALSVLSLAANRIVVREIQLRLEKASKEKISELAKQELINVLAQIKKQQDIEEKIDKETKRLDAVKVTQSYIQESLDKSIVRISSSEQKINSIETSQSEIKESLDKSIIRLDTAEETINNIKTSQSASENNLMEKINLNSENIAKQKNLFDELKTKTDNNEADLTMLNEDLGNLKTETLEMKSIIASLQTKISILEKKSFIDSSFFKVGVSILAMASFILSIIQFVM